LRKPIRGPGSVGVASEDGLGGDAGALNRDCIEGDAQPPSPTPRLGYWGSDR
jgi:hypothetical protein